MPVLTSGDVHVNRPLSNLVVGFMQQADGFVADRVFPNIPVEKQSDAYYKYDRSDWMRSSMQKRAPGTESVGAGWKITTDTYYADVWALHVDIADQIRANADDPLNLDRDATAFLATQALLNRELSFVANFFASGVWTTEVSGDTVSPGANNLLVWDDDNSTPISDVKSRATTMQTLSGYRPNKLILGRQVWDKLAEHPDIIDRINKTSGNASPALVTRQAVAAIFEVDEIVVMDGVQTTSNENPAYETGMTNALIGGKHALLAYAAPRPGIMLPSAGYTFSWTAFTGAGPQGQRIKRFRIETIESDRVESQMAYSQKRVAPDLGVFFANIVS
jgi:hypothetical protein